MVLPTALLIHSCTVRRRVRNYSLLYDSGTAVFTAGKTLTGATSHATAIIVSTGAAASGTLVLHTITGVFQNNEVLSDNGTIPGAALADGVIFDTLDAYGEISFTDVDTASVACRFISPQTAFKGNPFILVTSPRVLFPASITIAAGDQIISTVTGFAETYKVDSVKTVYEAAVNTISHFSCDIAAVV